MTNKQSDPWDDSALLNAFDDAITKYKKMHKSDLTKLTNEDSSTHIIIEETSADIVSSDNVENANDPPLIQEIHLTGSHPRVGGSNSQGVDDCNNLLKQYYELEEQREKVLQKLQQMGYWNYQSSGEVSGQWGACSVQAQQEYNQQTPHPTAVSYCCPPCFSPCSVTPCSSMLACSLVDASGGKKDTESTSLGDDTIVKTAMGAAEQALSSLNLNASGTNIIHEDSSEVQMPEKIIPGTDISAVFNAWYSAGFYTGKYLSEQSILKGKHG